MFYLETFTIVFYTEWAIHPRQELSIDDNPQFVPFPRAGYLMIIGLADDERGSWTNKI